MYIIYQIFYIIFLLFYTFAFVFKGRRRKGIGIRFGIYPDGLKAALEKRKNIWIHAVSVGEVMTAKSLVAQIKRELSQYNVVVSTVTETGNSLAKKIMPKGTIITYLPLELTFAIKRVIKLINPSLFIMIETEIWPNLIRRLGKNNVPIILSNGRISHNSYRWYKFIKPFLRKILDCITAFLMRTEEDRKRIVSVGAEITKVKVVGNIKFDSIDYSINEEEKQKVSNFLDFGTKKLIVAGSTHPGEEDILLKAYSKLKDKYKDLSLLIAPRHIERADEVTKLVKSYGLSVSTVSKIKEASVPTRGTFTPSVLETVLVLDTIGQLKLFYSLAWLVFVGGSLIKHGGQNMIEPAFFAKPILFGPHTFNFKDIASMFISGGGALLVRDTASLTKAISTIYEDEVSATNMGKRAKEIVISNQGATAETIDAVKTILQY